MTENVLSEAVCDYGWEFSGLRAHLDRVDSLGVRGIKPAKLPAPKRRKRNNTVPTLPKYQDFIRTFQGGCRLEPNSTRASRHVPVYEYRAKGRSREGGPGPEVPSGPVCSAIGSMPFLSLSSARLHWRVS